MASKSTTAPALSELQVAAIIEWAHAAGRDRARAQGLARFNSADFLAGVMTAFFACESQTRIPAAWIFGTFAGDDVLDVVADDERILLDAAKVVLQEKSVSGKVPNQLTSLRVAVQRLDPGWKPE